MGWFIFAFCCAINDASDYNPKVFEDFLRFFEWSSHFRSVCSTYCFSHMAKLPFSQR